MNLQGRYDLEIQRNRLAGALDEIRPLASASSSRDARIPPPRRNQAWSMGSGDDGPWMAAPLIASILGAMALDAAVARLRSAGVPPHECPDKAEWVRIANRSCSVCPPQIPYGSCTCSAWAVQLVITEHRAQISPSPRPRSIRLAAIGRATSSRPTTSTVSHTAIGDCG